MNFNVIVGGKHSTMLLHSVEGWATTLEGAWRHHVAKQINPYS